MLKRTILSALVLLAGAAYAQPTPIRIPPKYTVATAPACVDGEPKLYSVTDAASSASCAVGGGSTEVICQCLDGTASVVGSGAGGGEPSDGDKGDITVSGSGLTWVVDADSVALGTDTTGNYAGSSSEGGAATSATALAADPADCAANQYANAIAASGALTCAAISDADVPDGITVTLAGTATALAANGANCSAGQYPLGVDASGASESCTADDDTPDNDSEVPDAITVTGAVSPSTFTFPASAAPSQTTDAQAVWDSDDNRLAVGDGAATAVIYPGAHAGAVTDGGAATTATALAANGANCSAGQYPLGVDASGAVESCTADSTTPASDSITEAMLKAVDAAADEECLTYESTVGDFEWQSCGSGIGGSTGATDDAIIIADGVGGATVAASAATLTAAGSLTIPSAETIEISTDVGLARVSANLFKITDGSTGLGGLVIKDDFGSSKAALNFGGTGAGDGGLVWASSKLQVLNGSRAAYKPIEAEYFSVGGSARYVDGAIYNSLSSALNPFRALKKVEANTAGSGAPHALQWYEVGGNVWTNEGTTAKNYHTLPTATTGMAVTFVVQDTDGLRVTAAAGDDIRIGATTSTTAGYCESTTVGDSVTLVAINATSWYAVSLIGSGWTCAVLFPAFGVRRRLRDLIAANDNDAERKAA